MEFIQYSPTEIQGTSFSVIRNTAWPSIVSLDILMSKTDYHIETFKVLSIMNEIQT